MTVGGNLDSSSDSEDDLVDISHETAEVCKTYFSLTENLVRDEETFIERFKLAPPKKKSKVLSKAHIVRGLPWKVLVTQNHLTHNERTLLISIMCDIPTETLWSCSTKSSITLVNTKFPEKSPVKSFAYMYTYKERDCMIGDFISMKELYAPNSPFTCDGFFDIKVSLSADPPRGLTWDSRKISGYVGLINQGATCYLNSLLQTLYFAMPLKKIIFKAPTETDNRNRSVVLALQYTFMDLLYSDTCVDTKKLTNSFGWAPTEVYVQRDVQEMCRLLIDNIETKTKGTIVEGDIAKLMEGKSVATINCLNIDFCSTRTESFYDIQLSVKNMKNIYDSFDHYCAPEKLEGDNKYHAQEHGMQDAVKSLRFSKLPPLLHLHLLRFVVNMQTFNYEKVYDRFEFYKEIKLGKYLLENVEGRDDDTYYLQSVLVHCGSSNGGHYMAYVSPNCDSNWFKFDDEIVSSVHEQHAIENTFGSNDTRHCSAYTAYMLLYIKSSILSDPNYRFSESDIPMYLKTLYSKERETQQEELAFQNNRQNIIEVPIIFDDNLFLTTNNIPIDFSYFKPVSYYFPLEATCNDILSTVSKQSRIPLNQLRLWFLKDTPNNLIRPIYLYPDMYKHVYRKIYEKCRHPLLIERVRDETTPQFSREKHILIFLHTFSNDHQKIYYHGIFQAERGDILYNGLSLICHSLSIPFNDKTLVFVEKNPYDVQIVDTRVTFNKISNDEFDGESIIIQNEYDQSVNIYCSEFPFHYANQYLEEVTNVFRVSFIELNSPNDEASFILNLSKKMKLSGILQQISYRCGTDPEYIRLFKLKQTSAFSSAIPSSFSGSLSDIFNSLNRVSDHQRLYFQLLRVPVSEIENKLMTQIKFWSKTKQECILPIFRESNQKSYDQIMNLFLEMAFLYELSFTNPIRVVSFEKQTLTIIHPLSKIDEYLDESGPRKIRFEEIPDDQYPNCNATLMTVNIRGKNSQNIMYSRSFFIGIHADFTFENVVAQIASSQLRNISSYSIYNNRSKTQQPFPADLKKKFMSNILSRNTYGIADNDHVIDTATIIVEVNEPTSPRFHRSDPSFKIHN